MAGWAQRSHPRGGHRFPATASDSKAIDPDDNGRACDEGAYLFASGAANAQSSASAVSAGGGYFILPLFASERLTAREAEANCRMNNYVSNEITSVQEGKDFSTKLRKEKAFELGEDPTLSAGTAMNKALDDLGVPRYPKCKKKGE